MTTSSAIYILIDFLAVALLIYGFVNEEKVINFETKIKRKIYKAICKYEKRKAMKNEKGKM